MMPKLGKLVDSNWQLENHNDSCHMFTDVEPSYDKRLGDAPFICFTKNFAVFAPPLFGEAGFSPRLKIEKRE